MNNPRHFNRLAACSLAAALTAMAPLLQAEQAKPPSQEAPGSGGYGMGPGMMGGHGMMGPGMMGPGMMGPGMMGPGMMGGCGMMGGYGMGPGMMGHGMMGAYGGSGLDLTDEQQARINKIQDETRKSHWALMNEMMNQQARLRDLYLAPKRDNPAIDAAYKEIGKFQQRMYDSSVEAHKRMEAVLTTEQLEKQRTYWRKGGTPSQ